MATSAARVGWIPCLDAGGDSHSLARAVFAQLVDDCSNWRAASVPAAAPARVEEPRQRAVVSPVPPLDSQTAVRPSAQAVLVGYLQTVAGRLA